jgi:hypothetical protein
MLDLDSTNPEVATIEDVEYDQGWIASEFIADSSSNTVSIVLQLVVSMDREEPKY